MLLGTAQSANCFQVKPFEGVSVSCREPDWLTGRAAGVTGPEGTGRFAAATVGHRKAVTKDTVIVAGKL